MSPFRKYRSRDINVECGFASRPGRLPYYRIAERVEVAVRRLDDLLMEYLPAGQAIDFLTIDVEVKDQEVLESNDWDRFRPRFILAETLRTDMLHLADCSVVQFLTSLGYKPVAKADNTTFFACDGS